MRSNELPQDDSVIDALAADARERIGLEWLRRSEVELSAAALSADLVGALLRDRALPEVIALAANAVGEEVRHAHLCHVVAQRYLDREVPAPHARRIDAAEFGDAPPDVNRLLALVLHSCINETLATVCLRSGLKQAESRTAREATRQLLEDDLNHARIGWAHLASPRVTVEQKRHVSAALPTLLRLGRDCWLNEPRADFDEPAHAVLGNNGFPELFRVALTELILPGFDHVGIDTRAGRKWCGANGIEGA